MLTLTAHVSNFAARTACPAQGAAKQAALADRIQAAEASIHSPWDALPQHR